MARLSRTELDAVITRYAPLLCLHPKEKYLPCSIEWFLAQARLHKQGDSMGVPVSVMSLPIENTGDGAYWLDYPDTDAAKAGHPADASTYVHVRLGADETYTDIQYWYFYAYNGPGTAKVGSLVADTVVREGDADLAPMGEHFGDWEHAVVRIDNATKSLLGYYMSQHSGGEWIMGEDLRNGDKIAQDAEVRKNNPTVGADQLILYASRNGHAIYRWKNARNYTEHNKIPVAPGTAIELQLCNDTDENGPKFNSATNWKLIAVSPDDYGTQVKPENADQPRWLNYPYRWGPEGTKTTLQPENILKILSAALGEVGMVLAAASPAGATAMALSRYFYQDDRNGPEGPKFKNHPWNGTEIFFGLDETLETPFFDNGYIYFRGTNNGLYRTRQDGSGTIRIGSSSTSAGHETAARPIYYKGFVYFRGTNNGLYRVAPDGSGLQQISGLETIAAPCLYNDTIYFRGTNSGLYAVGTDGGGFRQIGNLQTNSTPFVDNEWIYFQGLDNGLYRVGTNGADFQRIGGNETATTPYVAGGWVYFQGTNRGLYRVRIDGTGMERIGANYNGDGSPGHETNSMPVAKGITIYFQGINNGLYQVNADGSNFRQINGHETSASPCVLDDCIYFRGMNQHLMRTPI